MYANHRHYILCALAFVTFVCTTLGYSYVRNRVYKQAINSAELIKKVAELEDKKRREAAVESTYTKLTDEQKLVGSYVVSADNVVGFIESVEKIGDTASTTLDISNINTVPVVKTSRIQDNFTTVTAHVNVAGTWANVMRTLTLIENMPYSISLNNIQVREDVVVDSAPQPVGTTTKPIVRAKPWTMSFDISALAL